MIPARFAPRHVLLLRPRGLGDVVLSSAVVDAVVRAYGEDVVIDFLSERASRGILECDERLAEIFLLGGADAEDRIRGGGTRAAWRWIRRRRPDLVVDLFSNPRTALLTLLSGARYRIGLDKRLRRYAYNVRVPRFHGDPATDRRWAADVQLDFLRGAGVRWEGEAQPSVALKASDRAFAEAALRELGYEPGDRFGAVLPGGSWDSKRWTPEGFAASARRLAERSGTPTLVVWGPPESDDARRIAELAGEAARLAPPTTLREMAALLGLPALLVATDCLGRHFSIVQGVPTVGIFATTDPRDWTPPFGRHGAVQGGPAIGQGHLRELEAPPVLAEIDRHFDEASLDSARSDT